MSLQELIRTIMQVTVIFILSAKSNPKLEHLFLLKKILAALKSMAKNSCWHIRRLFKILPQPFTLNCFHLCSTHPCGGRTDNRRKQILAIPVQTLHFPSLAHGQLVIHPLPCAMLGFRRKKPKKVFWWSLSLAGSSTAIMQIKLPTWAMGILFQREYHKKWVIMNYKEPGKYLNSCAATEVAMKRKKPFIFFRITFWQCIMCLLSTGWYDRGNRWLEGLGLGHRAICL